MGVNKEVTKPYAEQLDDRLSSPVLSPLKKKNPSVCLQQTPPSERDARPAAVT